METFERVVSLFSSVLGIGVGVAAVCQHLWTRWIPARRQLSTGSAAALGDPQPADAAHQEGVKLTSYRDESALARPRQPKYLRPLLFVGATAVLIPASFAIYHRAFGAALLWGVLSALYFQMAQWAGRKQSSTLKTATLTIGMPVEEVMDRSRSLLKRQGLRILSFNVPSGTIEARRGVNLRTFGEVVTIEVVPEGISSSRVTIVSDAAVMMTMGDWGANQRNVDRFVSGLVGE